eukprot:NODE_111_length_18624_cov_1.285020.p9 type:complete len:206 gc:universal NODE_111_length_18624_cov_1.285020:9233-8616(-)
MLRLKEITGLVAVVLGGVYYTWQKNNDDDNASIGDILRNSEIRAPGIMCVKGREIEGGKYAKTVSENNFEKGQVLMKLDFIKCENKTYQTLQLGLNTHAIEDFSSYFNHHCDPTVKIEVLTKHVDELPNGSIIKTDVIAVKDISVGDEINFAYFTTEWDMAEKFNCRCGSDHCRGYVGGASQMSLESLREYHDQLLPHILLLLKQ